MEHRPLIGKPIRFIRHNAFPIFIVLLFLSLFIIAIVGLLRESRTFADEVIAHDIQMLSDVFKSIDADCSIANFEHQKNYVDFLNVEKFVGDEVGSMQLMMPEKWQGPYVRENPKVFGKPFLIVRTKKGYFIVPPIGFKLSNGKKVGIDIKIDESADIQAMIDSPKGFRYQDKPLAAKISLSGLQARKKITLPPEEMV